MNNSLRKVGVRSQQLANLNRRARRHRAGKLTWREVLEILIDQDFHCAMCSGQFTTIRRPTIDHKIPLAAGGKNRGDNIQMLCEDCHREKDAKFTKACALLGYAPQHEMQRIE